MFIVIRQEGMNPNTAEVSEIFDFIQEARDRAEEVMEEVETESGYRVFVAEIIEVDGDSRF